MVIFGNSAQFRAKGSLLLKGQPGTAELFCRFGFFEHPKFGATLIDTGLSTEVIKLRSLKYSLRVMGAEFAPQTSIDFLAARGIAPADIKQIVLTHLHFDHVALLRHFSNARFFASSDAWNSISGLGTMARISQGYALELFPDDFASRLNAYEYLSQRPLLGDFRGYDLFGDRSFFAVPLPGHAIGHFGVYFPTENGPALYAADAHWLLAAVRHGAKLGGAGQFVVQNCTKSEATLAKLADFRAKHGPVLLCHDGEKTNFDAF